MSMGENITLDQYAAQNGKVWPNVAKALNRAEMPATKSSLLTDAAKSVIDRVGESRTKTADKKTTVRKDRTDTKTGIAPVLPLELSEIKTKDKDNGQRQDNTTDKDKTNRQRTKTDIVILYCLAIAPTVASVRNIFIVCMSVMGEWIGATALTAVLCSTGIALTYIGVRSRFAVVLVIAVMAFETLANVTTIFAGLFDANGLPLKFLGTVTDIFGSGTHGTAIFLAVFAALLLVCTQLAAIFELQKRS